MRDELLGPMKQPRYLGYARDINDSATVLLQLIQDILDISKAEAGKLDLDDEAVDIGQLAASAFQLLKQRAGRENIDLSGSIPADLPRLRGDGRRLRQVIVNLVSNAVKFTPAGGAVTVSAGLLPDGGIGIEVSDSGIGIPPAMIEAVFQPFVQLESQASRRHEGTGLGLPMCRTLVELHGGSIRLESSEAGTRAIIALPTERTIR
jgi:signal transduction histidine kinase